MGFMELKCPNCGATIELNYDKEFGFCTFCGTKVIQEKLIVEHKGKVSVSGIADESSFLERSFIFLEEGNFNDADSYLEKVLDINPHCSMAYIGKLMCQLQLKSIALLGFSQKPLNTYSLFKKALRFATSDESEEYNSLLEKSIDNFNVERNKRQSVLQDLDDSINEVNTFLESNKVLNIKNHVKRVLFFVFSVVTFLFSGFFIIGFSTDDGSGVISFYVFSAICLFASLAFLLFLVINLVKTNKNIKTYESNKTSLYNLISKKNEELLKYNEWKSQMS